MRLRYQFLLIQTIREFFHQNNYLEVLTPPLVENPGMETHIHPFKVSGAQDEKKHGYLHTSPEFKMKELLSLPEENFDKIYQISYVFRDEPSSPIHRNQFLMLEWYQKDKNYLDIMEETFRLIQFCHNRLKSSKKLGPPKRISVAEAFREILNVEILEYLEKEKLKNLIKDKFPDVPLPHQDCAWDDYYFLLFLNKVEPKLSHHPLLSLYDFPAPLAALSKLKKDDPRVCERFEIYMNGVELCNAFTELTDYQEQKERFKQQAFLKKETYGYQISSPTEFLESLKRGLPNSTGNALGVERLLKVLLDTENPFFT